jgi:hypothetical protein
VHALQILLFLQQVFDESAVVKPVELEPLRLRLLIFIGLAWPLQKKLAGDQCHQIEVDL